MQALIDKRTIELAHRMADTAGDILRRYWGQSHAVEHKADASPVTHADREVEAVIRTLIEAEFPNQGIFGEEHGRLRPDAAWQWVIDPIDGTHAFIAGQPTFTTLIALAKDGIPLLGLIDQPVSKERWLGISGQNTMCNGAMVQPRPCTALSQAMLATTAMKYFKPPQAALFEHLKEACKKTMFGGDAYLYANLASGKLDIVMEASLKPYDFCALRPVVEGAGGIITDWHGKPLTLDSDGTVLAAATPELHQQALRRLTGA